MAAGGISLESAVIPDMAPVTLAKKKRRTEDAAWGGEAKLF